MILLPFGDKYKIPYGYNYKDIIVPSGFTTDGISYKFRLLGIFINKFDPRYIEAVVVHDYLTDIDDWEKANRYFEELLPKTNTSKLMIIAVKGYRKLIRK